MEYADVAQLVRVAVSKTESQWFESIRLRVVHRFLTTDV